MTFLTDPEFWARLVSIVLIDLSLAGDNALVIALAVRSLPAREQWLGRMWGTVAAVALRLFFIAIVSALLTIPLLRFAGGLLLLWIAVRLVRPGGTDEGEVRHGTSLRQAVWIIVVADVTMSLDNVLAVAAAAHGDFLLVTIGIALSLPIVVWGSGFLARLMAHHAWIIWIGGGVLGYVADTIDDPLSLLLAVGLALLGWWLARGAASGPTAREGA
jgi:YjbE family integral membrane protein